MKTDELIILALAGVAAWLIVRSVQPATAKTTQDGRPSGYVTEIANSALPGEPGYGWRYFSDGTVIDPAGNYYSNGVLVYSPA